MKNRRPFLLGGLLMAVALFGMAQVSQYLPVTPYTRSMLTNATEVQIKTYLNIASGSNTFNTNQFTLIGGTNVNIKSGATTTNLLLRGNAGATTWPTVEGSLSLLSLSSTNQWFVGPAAADESFYVSFNGATPFPFSIGPVATDAFKLYRRLQLMSNTVSSIQMLGADGVQTNVTVSTGLLLSGTTLTATNGVGVAFTDFNLGIFNTNSPITLWSYTNDALGLIRLGTNSVASTTNAMALGQGATATNYGSSAIGTGARTTQDYQLRFGQPDDTNSMPGHLEVGGNFAGNSGIITNKFTNGVFRSTWETVNYLDATNVPIDCSTACSKVLTLTNTAYLYPTNIPATMQTIWVEIKTGSGGHVISFSPAFSFGASAFTTNTTNAAKVDLLGIKTSNSATNVHAFFNSFFDP